MPIYLQPYNPESEMCTLEFIEANPWPSPWPRTLLVRFLNELVSSSDLLFDIYDGSERVGFAALLDKVNNPANDANLELLALRGPLEPILELVISTAKTRLPSCRSGFAIGFPADFELPSRHQMKVHFEMYDMQNSHPEICAIPGGFELSVEADELEIFAALKVAFRENPDTSIPSFEDWRIGRTRNQNRRTWLLRDQGKIVAFLNLLFTDHEAEISTVGVLPQCRGKGYARRLIAHALSEFPAKSYKLSVAVQNRRALGLYESLGFAITDHQRIFRWSR